MSLRPQIEEALKDKLRVSDIAKQFGVTKGYVSNVKKKGDGMGRLSISSRIQIAFLWGKDNCATEISQKLNLPKLRVIRFLQDEGLI